ncbi:MAG: flippase-like domain-containing protein [Alphaproteobacteria bacterium]|jgi:uncharacterized protein (TIRG00374 family)|nr:flippase-like domain-containing protein [Alphaproteobacteria bacterium]
MTGDPAPRLARSRRIALGLAAGFVLAFVIGAALTGRLDRVAAEVLALPPALVLVLAATSLANFALRARRWQIAQARLGLDLPYPRTLLYFMAGYALLLTPGRIGEAVRLWLLRRGHGARYEHSFALLALDRLSDGLVFVLFILAGLASFPGFAGLAAGIATLLGLALWLFFRPAPLLALVGWGYRRLGRWPRGFARLRVALRQGGRIVTPALAAAMLVLSLAAWTILAGGLALLLRGLGTTATLIDAMFILGAASAAGALIVVPGGLGGTEGAMLALITGLGTSAEAAIAATLVFRALTLWLSVAIGFPTLAAAIRLTGRP